MVASIYQYVRQVRRVGQCWPAFGAISVWCQEPDAVVCYDAAVTLNGFEGG